MENRLYEVGEGQTVGAQTIALASLLIPDNSVCIIEMKVGAITLSGLAGGVVRTAVVKKINGVLTNLGDILAAVTRGDAGLGGVVVAPAFQDGNIILNVTGIAGQTIDWVGAFMGIVQKRPVA